MTGQGKGTSPLPACLWVPSLACSVRVPEKGTCVYGGSYPCVCGGEEWAESSSFVLENQNRRKWFWSVSQKMSTYFRLRNDKCRGLADALVRGSTVDPPPTPSVSCCSSTWLSSASSRAQTCETLPACRIRDFNGVPLHFSALTWTVLKDAVWALWRKFERRIMPL